MATKRPMNRCKKCGETWYSRGSDTSTRCPECGNRHVAADRPSVLFKVLACLFVAAMLGGGILGAGACLFAVMMPSGKGGTKQEAEARPVRAVEFTTLLTEWKANPVATADRYKDANPEFTAVIISVESAGSKTYVRVGADQKSQYDDTVNVYLLTSELVAALKDFPVGSRARFRIAPPSEIDSRLQVRCLAISKP